MLKIFNFLEGLARLLVVGLCAERGLFLIPKSADFYGNSMIVEFYAFLYESWDTTKYHRNTTNKKNLRIQQKPYEYDNTHQDTLGIRLKP